MNRPGPLHHLWPDPRRRSFQLKRSHCELPRHGLSCLFQHDESCSKKNSDVAQERHVLPVSDVQLDHSLERGFVFAADLPQTCNARDGIESLTLFNGESFELISQAGPWTNQSHLTSQDVEQLRKLVQTRGSQQPAQWNQARIAESIELCHGDGRAQKLFKMSFMRACVGVHHHGSEFEALERLSEKSDPFLPEKYRPA